MLKTKLIGEYSLEYRHRIWHRGDDDAECFMSRRNWLDWAFAVAVVLPVACSRFRAMRVHGCL
jgi:hypothetical protein